MGPEVPYRSYAQVGAPAAGRGGMKTFRRFSIWGTGAAPPTGRSVPINPVTLPKGNGENDASFEEGRGGAG